MPKNEYQFDASKPKLENLYEDVYSNLPADILREFVATMATQHSIFELQALCEKHTGMGEVIKAYAMRPLIQKDFGKRALTIYDNLIQQDNHKDLSLSKYYLICKKLKEEVEQLREFINSNEMKFVTVLADWPVQSAAELNDLNNFFDKTIKKHYQGLIAYLARPGLQNVYGRTPLTLAAFKGHFATVKALLAQPGIDVNKADNYGDSSLIWAAHKGHHEIVKLLLAQPGIDVSKADDSGGTPLIWAALKGYLEIVKELLARPDIDVNKANDNGDTSLTWAARNGHLEIVKELLTQPCIDVNKAEDSGETSLYWAAYKGHLEIVRELLAQPSIDVNKADNDGRTPLNRAAFYCRLEIVKMLLDKTGTDVDKADKNGNTPLYWAELSDYKEIALLIKNHIATKNKSATAATATPGYAALRNQDAANNGAVNTSNSNNFSMM